MRIIGGKFKSRRIERPNSPVTRPVADRVKESVFNLLGHHYGCLGALPPVCVADVFAGGGSMGLEALSRGAAHCVFFERDRSALAVLNRNLIALGVQRDATIISRDAWAGVTLEVLRRAVHDTCRVEDDAPGLILLDPPYRDVGDLSPQGKLWRFLDRLGERPSRGRLLVFHHPKRVDLSEVGVRSWRMIDRRSIGSNGVTVLTQ